MKIRRVVIRTLILSCADLLNGSKQPLIGTFTGSNDPITNGIGVTVIGEGGTGSVQDHTGTSFTELTGGCSM